MTEIRITEHHEQRTAVVREQVAMDALPAFFQRAFNAAMGQAQAQGLQVTGPPFGKYYGMPGETVDVEAGFPVSGPVSAADGVIAGTLPGGRVVEAMHVGLTTRWRPPTARWSAGSTSAVCGAIDVMWEAYLTDPGEQPDPATWQTLLCVPLAPDSP